MTTRFIRSLALATFCASSAPLSAQCANAWQSTGVVPGIDGNVDAVARWDPDGPGPLTERVVVGGGFTVAGGVPANSVAAWDPATGTWSALGSGIGGFVTTLLALPNGDLVAGGGDNLARWNGSTWVAFGGLTPSGIGVKALALLPNGDIAVGGWFTAAGTTTLNHIGVWNGTTWSTLGGGTDGPVNALTALPNGDLVAGGYFSTAGGVAADGIARWNGSSWSSLGFVPAVWKIAALSNGDLVAVGQFTQANGPANGVARWNGTAWSALGTGLSGIGGPAGSEVVVMPNGDLVVGGGFNQAGGVAANGIARWNGSAWSSLGTGTSGTVRSLAVLTNGDLVAGGGFTAAGGVAASHVARWDGAAWSAMAGGSAPSGMVNALVTMPDGSLVAGGRFFTAGSLVTNHIARWNGSLWSALGGGLTSAQHVNTMLLRPNGDLLVGGAFVSQWNGTAWTALGPSFGGQVNALAALPNGDIVAGGDFQNIGSSNVAHLARWDGTSWSLLGGGIGGGFDQAVHALAVLANGDLVVGGWLGSLGGAQTNGIARWNGTSWSALGSGLLGGSSASAAYAIEPLPNGGFVAGGVFSTAGGAPANNIAIWNGTSWSPLGTGMNGAVTALARLPNGDLLAGGTFTQAGGVAANRIARWNGAAWSPVGTGLTLWTYSSPPTYGGVRAIVAAANGDLIVGGSITFADGQPSANLARLTTTCAASAQSQGAGCAGDTVTSSLPWTGSTWRADATGLPNAALVFVVNGFATASLPLAAVFATALPGCTLHVRPDVVDLVFANQGTATFEFAVPNTPALAGTVFHHQMVPLALDTTLAVTATNALTLTVGSF